MYNILNLIMSPSLIRCPNNVLDFYEVIKYVSSNSKELGVDASRIAMAGEKHFCHLLLIVKGDVTSFVILMLLL